ncbi:hypothetical protein D3C80_1150260 [compost metagenome]
MLADTLHPLALHQVKSRQHLLTERFAHLDDRLAVDLDLRADHQLALAVAHHPLLLGGNQIRYTFAHRINGWLLQRGDQALSRIMLQLLDMLTVPLKHGRLYQLAAITQDSSTVE